MTGRILSTALLFSSAIIFPPSLSLGGNKQALPLKARPHGAKMGGQKDERSRSCDRVRELNCSRALNTCHDRRTNGGEIQPARSRLLAQPIFIFLPLLFFNRIDQLARVTRFYRHG